MVFAGERLISQNNTGEPKDSDVRGWNFDSELKDTPPSMRDYVGVFE
jgi:hypothetical protein